jgi:LuxR family maltose regulon positive regulatory protein
MSFARTKLQPPRPRAGTVLIERPALQRRLGEALLSQRLVLLCAAAGYGKTATLAQQVQRLPAGTALAWVAADEGDDLPLLLECLVAALEPWDPPWRTDPQALVAAIGDATPRAVQAVAAELINTLDACDVAHGVIAIDDLHRIDDPAVHDFLDRLLERLTPRWTLAATTRREPPLALSRLRASGELAEFGPADLRFGGDEARALAVGVGLDADAADGLMQRTAGWAAGLRMALNALRHGSAGAAPSPLAVDRALFDFMASEVIDRLPSELRDFLLRTSVLPELSASRAAAVSGHRHAAALLDEVQRLGLFVSLHDGAEPTLRLHDLLREALEQRLQREHADELPALWLRAAAGETDVRRRIGWLLRAGAHDEAQRALVEATPALLAAGDSARVLRLLEQFPPALRDGSPLLAYVRGVCAWPRFEWGVMDRKLAQAAAGLERAGLGAMARRARAWRIVALASTGDLDQGQAELEALSTALAAEAPAVDVDLEAHHRLMGFWLGGACGPADAPARHLQAMLASLQAGADASLWYRCAPHFMFIGRPGLQAPLEQYVATALEVAGDSHVPLRAAAHALGAWCLLWSGRLDESDARIAQAREDERWLGSPRSLRLPVLVHGAARAAMLGDADAVRRLGQAMIDDVEHDASRRPTWLGVFAMMTGRMALAAGDADHARAMQALLLATPAHREWPFMAGARRMLEGALRLHDGDLDAALALLEGTLPTMADVETFGLEVSTRALAALARLRRGDVGAAAAWLEPALARTRGGPGAVRATEVGGWWMTGRAALGELAGGAWGRHLDAADVARLREWRDRLEALAGGTPRQATRAVEDGGLSERERDVLARIAAGDSNKLIARAFDLSPHTVKRHVANILDKLGVESRGQAAAWWQARQRP